MPRVARSLAFPGRRRLAPAFATFARCRPLVADLAAHRIGDIQLGNLCHPGWTRRLIPSGDRKPLVMCGHGLDGEAPLRRMRVDAQFKL